MDNVLFHTKAHLPGTNCSYMPPPSSLLIIVFPQNIDSLKSAHPSAISFSPSSCYFSLIHPSPNMYGVCVYTHCKMLHKYCIFRVPYESPYTKWHADSWLTGGCCVTQHYLQTVMYSPLPSGLHSPLDSKSSQFNSKLCNSWAGPSHKVVVTVDVSVWVNVCDPRECACCPNLWCFELWWRYY